jgi:hypothetical protein
LNKEQGDGEEHGGQSDVGWEGHSVYGGGLVAILALLLALAYVALAAGGNSDRTDGISQLVGSEAGADQALAVETVARRRTPSQGFAQVNHSGPSLVSSKGVIGVQRTDTGIYCFDLSFTPRAAVASGNINNNATVGTALGSSVPSGCVAPYRDAAAKTYAANDLNSTTRSDLSFGIIFMR